MEEDVMDGSDAVAAPPNNALWLLRLAGDLIQ